MLAGVWVWLDLEMTGLVPEVDQILEIAMLVTDFSLNIQGEFGPMAIRRPQAMFDRMDAWCQKTHFASGLWDRVQSSPFSESEVEQAAIRFLKNWVEAGKAPMCGNTLSQDRLFLRRYMPSLSNYFHYRSIDVSSLKELARIWFPEELKAFKKSYPHRALEDLYASVEELKFYRDKLFKPIDLTRTGIDLISPES